MTPVVIKGQKYPTRANYHVLSLTILNQLNTIKQINSDGSTLNVILTEGSVQLQAVNNATLHVTCRFAAEPNAIALPYPLAQVELQAGFPLVPTSTVTVPHGAMQATIHFETEPFQIKIVVADSVIYEDLAGRAYQREDFGRKHHYQRRRDSDRFYGLGEKTGRLERSHRRFRMKNVDAVGYDPEHGDPLYKHIPFYIRHQPDIDHAIGIYYHNAYSSSFDIGSERSGYWGSYSSACFDGGLLDFYIFLGPTIADVLQQYMQLTGFPTLPTKASLGYMGSTMYYTELPTGADKAVLGFVAECERQQIPLSGFHLSSGYTKGDDDLRYTFNWRKAAFPDPARFVTEMNARNQVLSPNVKPGFLTSHPLFAEFDAAGAFIRTDDGSQSHIEQFWGGHAAFVDFSNAAARALWTTHLTAALLRHGVTSVWNDNNEFELDSKSAICDNDGDPIPAQAMRPVLSNLMSETAYDAVLNATNKRPFILSRAGFAGIQRYAQTWSGDNRSDWANFRFNIATMLGMSLSGVPFNGMDIGGFTGPPPEPMLFLRWVQNGVFHPRFCIHSVNDDNTVTEPWLYPDLLPHIQAAVRLRYQLLPMLYSLAFAATQRGAPLVRPLVYDFPTDPQVAEIDDCFLLGDGLLIVPVLSADLTHIPIYLPYNSRWHCWYTGAAYDGGQTVMLPVEQAHSPLLWREGSAVFLDEHFRPIDPHPELTIRIGVQQSGSATFYDDDGSTMSYQDGAFLRSDIVWIVDDPIVTIRSQTFGSHTPSWQVINWECQVTTTCPQAVLVNGKQIPKVLYQHQQAVGNWYYDAARRRVCLKTAMDALQEEFTIMLHTDLTSQLIS